MFKDSPLINLKRAVVIVVNWNGKNFLHDCLSSVLNQSYSCYSVILVDNGSVDGSVSFVRKFYPSVEVIEIGYNSGFAHANNVAIRESINRKVDFIALLNNDTRAENTWLEYMIREFESDEEVGICASKILLMSNPKIIDSTGHIFKEGKIGDRGNGEFDAGQYDDKTSDIIGACAGACLYRREMLEDIGLFDEDFIFYMEDAELSWRAYKRGWKAKFAPQAVVYHHHSGTVKSVDSSNMQKYVEISSRNIAKMVRKHATFFQKIRNSYAWLKMGLSLECEKRITGRGSGGALFWKRIKILWSKSISL